MSFNRFRPFTAGCALAVLMLAAPLVLGQNVTPTQTSTATRERSISVRSIPSGSKMKFRGVVIERNADTFTIRDRSRADYQVVITDNTSIKTHGGFFRRGKSYPVTDILRGLIVEVEGRGDNQGALVVQLGLNTCGGMEPTLCRRLRRCGRRIRRSTESRES